MMSVHDLEIGPMYEIVDLGSNKVLTRGYIRAMKDSAPPGRPANLVSLDGKWFFNLDWTGFFAIRPAEGPILPISPSDLARYVPVAWRECVKHIHLAPVYRENDMSELDPEIEPLVKELNRWKGIKTLGSCCGHRLGPAWVSMNVTDLSTLDAILRPIRNVNCPSKAVQGMFDIVLSEEREKYSNYPPAMVYSDYYADEKSPVAPLYLVIATKRTGKGAYEDVRAYADLLAGLRTRLYDEKE